MWGPAIILFCYTTGCAQFVFTPGPAADYAPTEAACVEHWTELAKAKAGETETAPDKIVVQCKDYEDKGELI